MSVVKVFPVLDGHLVVKILNHLVTFLESLESVKVSLCTLDALNRLLKLDLGASAFSSLSLDKLLFLQMDDGALFLASLEKFLNLVSRLRVLLCQLLLVRLQFAQLPLDLKDGLVVIRDSVLTSTAHRHLGSVVARSWRL